MQVLKAQSLSMDKSLCESDNSVSVVVHHGRRKFFVRIDMNKYAKTQITQYNSPWGYWKLIALYIITLGFSVHQMENIKGKILANGSGFAKLANILHPIA